MTEMLSYNDPHSPFNSPKRKLERFIMHLGKRKALNLAIFTFALMMLPIVMIAVQQQTNVKQHASSTQVVFVDQNNQDITQTSSPTVKVKLTSPYAVLGAKTKELSMKQDYASVLAAANATYQVSSSIDDLNEVGGRLDINSPSNSSTIWIGTGGTGSYTGLRFTNIQLPRGAKINSARIAVQSNADAWIGMKFQIAAENVANSSVFSATSRPSQRVLTATRVNHSSNVKWSANNWYPLDEINTIIQEVINRSDWKPGNSISIIFRGNGSGFGRKFVKSFDAGATVAPKLLIGYEAGTTQPTITPTLPPTNTPVPPTATPTSIPVTNTPIPPTATNTPMPATATSVPASVTTTSILLAEDPNFLTNVQTITPVTTNPTFATYTFSNTTPGEKLLFAKFKSSSGQEQVFSSSITLTQIASSPSPTGMTMNGESMALSAWKVGGKNAPNPLYDKCDDGTDVVAAHKAFYVVAYDGLKYPTWHPPVVTNPITGNGKCYFGHEHGTDPQKYIHWDEVYKHFGKDMDGDGVITPLVINSTTGVITSGDRAGIPFGIANEHMDMYYGQDANGSSIFVRHEDHVGHKIELVNNEAETQGNSTHTMTQLAGTNGINVPYYDSNVNGGAYQPTGVVCTHLHKFHQGTNSGDAIRNNLHEAIFHSSCQSVNVNNINAPAYYPNNTVILTGMMAFGNPAEYVRFCFSDRSTKVCPDGKNPDGSCIKNDPLISKLPNAINSTSLGRNMVDKYCFDNFTSLNPGLNYFNPYELWEGDLAIYRTNSLSDSTRIAEHGRQWDVLDPVRYVDPASATGFGYNQDRCNQNLPYSGNCDRGVKGAAWNSPQAAFKGLVRTAYFGRNHIANSGGSQIYWTDPFGGNAASTQFGTGLKQSISTVTADIQAVQSRIQQLYGGNNFLNDRALQRTFNDGGNTVHAPN